MNFLSNFLKNCRKNPKKAPGENSDSISDENFRNVLFIQQKLEEFPEESLE